MWSRIFDVARKEFLQLRRDRRMLPLIIISPVLQLIIYGYAISTTVSHITAAVYDAARTPESRSLVLAMQASGYFDVNHYANDLDSINGLVDKGFATVAIVIPHDFSRKLSRQTPVAVQLIVDGSDPNTATTALGYLQAIFRRYSMNVLVERFGRIPEAGVNPRIRVWYNPTLESRNYMIPGIICIVMLQITMNLTALSIVRERERGTIEQLIVTPIRKHELIIGKMLPYVVTGYLDVFLVLLAGSLIFRVPIQGSVILLLALTGIFLLNSLGLGLFMSSIARTQQQATVAIPFIMMPNFLLSGFFYPIDNMPKFVQLITYLIPLRYYLAIVRSIFLKGTGINLLWNQIIPMTILGAAIFAGSIVAFRKKL